MLRQPSERFRAPALHCASDCPLYFRQRPVNRSVHGAVAALEDNARQSTQGHFYSTSAIDAATRANPILYADADAFN